MPSQKSQSPKNDFADKIRAHAVELGFDLVGFSPVDISDEAYAQYEAWLDAHYEADMSYMSREDAVAKRRSAAELLPNAKSVVVLATNYYYDQPELPRDHGRIARYAYGRDYHKEIGGRLKKLEEFIKNETQSQTLSYVDTGPILERSLAVQAGLGFVGKNSCLITKEFGSWILLAEIITTIDLALEKNSNLGIRGGPLTVTCKSLRAEDSQPAKSSKLSCGTCTRCIDACPTGAIKLDPKTKTYSIDSNLCLSYHTIENRAETLPEPITQAIHKTKRIFGCDICQEVCPHNCRAKNSHTKNPTQPNAKTTPTPIAGPSLPLDKIVGPTVLTTDEEFTAMFAGSPIHRAKRKGLKRNAEAAR
jgi:epoxyqueuosine reductase